MTADLRQTKSQNLLYTEICVPKTSCLKVSVTDMRHFARSFNFYIEVSRISMKKISQMALTKLTGLLQQKTMTLI